MRTRVLIAVLGAATLGMLGAGLTSYLVQRDRADSRIDESLAQEVAEFREFAASGVDPETGGGFTSVDRFLEVVLQRNIPDANEGLLAIVDDRPRWVPGTDTDLELDSDPEFIDTVVALPDDAPIRARTAETSLGSLRYIVVPVSVAGDPVTGEYVVAYSRDLEQAVLNSAYQTYAVVAGVSVLLIAGVGWVVTGRLLRPLRSLRATAQRISDTDLSERIAAEGSDEVSEIAHTVNAMLDRLETAFENQRDALDDAGHELRTPITIIQGHLEVMNTADEREVADTRTLVFDELDRMRRLVDDLVLLAKAKRPDFLRPHDVELDHIVDDVVDKAQAMADRSWRVDHRASGTGYLDGQRVTQALLQLVSNAVKFTAERDVIAVGSQVTDSGVHLWVRDTGEGIAADDLGRIFERFTRVDTVGENDGSGLGLAIVAAIAEAHHGTVDVESVPGSGSRFTLVLPLSPSPTMERASEWR